jgi:phage shock protein PspC (stress-responsive transcriptional regulator)
MTESTPGNDSGTTTEPPPQQPGWNTEHLKDYRALRRSLTDRKIAGVAGGLARHLDVDPTIVRVLLVVLAFFGGAGILLYGALWLLVPEDGRQDAVISTSESARNGLLIAAAVVAAALALGDTWSGFWFPLPLAVIGLIVAAVLLSRDSRNRDSAGQPTTPYPAYAPAPAYAPVPPRPTRRGPVLFGITLALIALALGALGLYEASGAAIDDAAYPALALAVIGLMLVVGAFWGRPGGLIALGLVAALVLAAVSIGNPGFDGDRDRVVTPVRAADVSDSYDVPAGRVVLDLTQVLDLDALDGRTIELDANAGELVVIVPDDLGVDFDAEVQYGGEIVTPVGSQDGWGSELQGHMGDDASPVVALELDLKFGHIEVREQ